ncbi:unnamed protein product, partial [Mesorhabditis belari]|uniref:Uncharacterized protein n=1 Tax=Mesorhabditis belari TaxID=2138241 RepID=A0AAF3EW75_9BILA
MSTNKLTLSSITPRRVLFYVSAGIGACLLWRYRFLLGRLWKRRRLEKNKSSTTQTSLRDMSMEDFQSSPETAILTITQQPEKARSFRSRATPSISFSPIDTSIINSLEICREMIALLARASNGIELLKNRSEKDKTRTELLNSVVTRLRILETDISQLVSDPGNEKNGTGREDTIVLNGFTPAAGIRSGTLSVLSDDSFMSALDDFGSFEEEYEERFDFDKTALEFLQEGVQAVLNGQVRIRKNRADVCQCEDDTDFAAKVHCLRKALNIISADEKKRLWLANSGRQLLGGLLIQCKQKPDDFYRVFDEMQQFLESDENREKAEAELKSRNVGELTVWDVLMDFILLDAFDDLKNPPSAVYSVTKNNWLSQNMKYSTISTVIWSMLKAKRQRLLQPNGFIAHFYNISEIVSPAITLGFLGTDEGQRELCHFFKDQVTQLTVEIFDEKRVRYTTVEDLSNDIWAAIQNRTEALLSRISSELL